MQAFDELSFLKLESVVSRSVDRGRKVETSNLGKGQLSVLVLTGAIVDESGDPRDDLGIEPERCGRPGVHEQSAV